MGRNKKVLPDYAGLIDQRKNRLTKTIISLYDSMAQGIESDPNLPYATVCEDHGNVVCHRNKRDAVAHMARPEGWCEDCAKIVP